MEKLKVRTVAIDIDQTIAGGAIHAFIQHYNRDLQLGLTPEKIVETVYYTKTFHVPEILAFHQAHGEAFEASRQKIKTSPLVHLALHDIPGAVEGVRSLCDLGTIRYYTVRTCEVAQATREWLSAKQFPNPQEVILCEHPRDKLLKIIRTERLDDQDATASVLLIDDRYEQLISVAQALVEINASLKDYFRRLILVAFGLTDEAIQSNAEFPLQSGLTVLGLPSWDKQNVDALKRHFQVREPDL